MIRYALPRHGMRYDGQAITNALTDAAYRGMKYPLKAMARDLDWLLDLTAIIQRPDRQGEFTGSVNLACPSQITESEFFERLKNLPTSKTYSWLRKP